MNLPRRTQSALSTGDEDATDTTPRKVATCERHGSYSLAVAVCPHCASERVEARHRAEVKRIGQEMEWARAAGRASAEKRRRDRERKKLTVRQEALRRELAAVEARLVERT